MMYNDIYLISLIKKNKVKIKVVLLN